MGYMTHLAGKRPNDFCQLLNLVGIKFNNMQYAIIFCQSLLNKNFFTSTIDPDILIDVLSDYFIFLIWDA